MIFKPDSLTIICFLSILLTSAKPLSANSECINVIADTIVDDPFIELQNKLLTLINKNDAAGINMLAQELDRIIVAGNQNTQYLSNIHYFSGTCYFILNEYEKSITRLSTAVNIFQSLNIQDSIYSKTLFNLGVAYSHTGDYMQLQRVAKEYLNSSLSLNGPESKEVAEAYSLLLLASINLRDFTAFYDYVSGSLDLIKKNPEAYTSSDLIDLYQNIGIGYEILGDFNKSRIYLEKSEEISVSTGQARTDSYINLLSVLTQVYDQLEMRGKKEEYNKKTYEQALKHESQVANSALLNYARQLALEGQFSAGETIIKDIIRRTIKEYGITSRYYYASQWNHGNYLMRYPKDYNKAVVVFSKISGYINNTNGDPNLRADIASDYAEALLKNGEPEKALAIIQSIIELYYSPDQPLGEADNPPVEKVTRDANALDIFNVKCDILKILYQITSNSDYLVAMAGSCEQVLTIIDVLRNEISEEESRIILGATYREAYLLAISTLKELYDTTGDQVWLHKAFGYAEKSKVAGLLTSTREMNALKMHIPAPAVALELSLQKRYAFYTSLISKENEKESPVKGLLTIWNDTLINIIHKRDSLIRSFEKDYPEYYSLKFDNSIPGMNQITKMIGRNINYISYVVSDSILYTFIINRKNTVLLSSEIDSTFFSDILKFRNLLSHHVAERGVRNNFALYHETGYRLFSSIIKPVEKFLISDKLMVSTDNILAYVPIESLIASKYDGNDVNYRNLDYLFLHYDFSYTYSAVFMAELQRRKHGSGHTLLAMAPAYPETINIDSLIPYRSSQRGLLYDLPFAREEAEFVAEITRGDLLINRDASESAYKNRAGLFDILHLAMHTYIDDQDPVNSSMIFSREADDGEDGLLRVDEIYNIPLKARMVFLSSCNTGSGKLLKGEGVLSVARGFLYSGSQSVVMSLWEIEDKSGTDIVSSFYKNLKRGYSKSKALRKARVDYLANANQVRSQPYFWSALVVYGNNSPLYMPRWIIAAIILVVVGLGIYLGRRMYS